MREFLTSGSVGGVGGDPGSYPEADMMSLADGRDGGDRIGKRPAGGGRNRPGSSGSCGPCSSRRPRHLSLDAESATQLGS